MDSGKAKQDFSLRFEMTEGALEMTGKRGMTGKKRNDRGKEE